MKIRIIGCGHMGRALAEVLTEQGKKVSLYDRHPERAESLGLEIGAEVVSSPLENISLEDFLLLAIKPQDFSEAVQELKGFLGACVMSIITGVSLAQLKEAIPGALHLRMMPNLAVRYGDGVIALAENPDLDPMKSRIEEELSTLGLLKWIPETQFDAITALTGSGPAFFFAMIEGMVDAAVEMGFSTDEGYELVKQMVGGSLTTLYESDDTPGELIRKFSSPAGTTVAGLKAFEQKNVRQGIVDTFLASYARAQELSK